jgi:hypothetical protein
MRLGRISITIFFLVLGYFAHSQGLRTVCYNDSIVTVSFDDILDPCGNHSYRILYGSIDNGPFTPYDTTYDLSTNQLVIKLFSDLPDVDTDRYFFITTFFGCSGSDTLNTDTLIVDQVQPDDLQIDSVSIDINTQNVLVGWQSSTSPDTEGYRVYEYNNAVYSLIDETNQTHYVLNGTPANQNRTYGLVAYDTCRNFSPFLDRHKAMNLQASFDTCTRRLDFNWTAYQGFSTDSYRILHNLNNSGWQTISTQSTNSANYNTINPSFNLGDSVCLAIRTNSTSNPDISTTSNVVCIFTRELQTPNEFELVRVTVTNDEKVQVELQTNPHPDYPTAQLFTGSSFNNLTLNREIDINNTLTVINDASFDVDNEVRYYSFELLDKCRDSVDRTDTSRNILLEMDEGDQSLDFSWNSYITWSGGVDFYDFEERIDDGSTWNVIDPNLNTTNTSILPPNGSADPCYRVQAYRDDGVVSESNWVCTSAPYRVWIPNGVNPNSENNRFQVVTTGVNLQKSSYKIYNRWGQQIFQAGLSSPWNLTYQNKPVMPGIYLYIIEVISSEGERQQFHGEFVVLQ